MGLVFESSAALTGAVLVKSQYYDAVINTVYFNNFLGATVGGRELFPKRNAGGDTASRWILRRAGGAPEIFTEGQAQAAPTVSSYGAAAVAWTYARSN